MISMQETHHLDHHQSLFLDLVIFYHTKAIIRDYNITFDESIWDLNPEGIGVQPMIANVSLTLSLIGGQGMKETVNELQNALSSNFLRKY